MKEQTEAKSKIVKELVKKFEGLPIHNSKQLKNMAINWAIYNGRHHFSSKTVKESVDKLFSTYPDGIKHKSKINVITGNTDIAVSKIMKEQPIPVAVPAGMSKDDEHAATVGTIILENIFSKDNTDLVQRGFEVETLAKVQGTGWVKVVWDKDAQKGKGDYVISTYDNFQVFPDPTASDYFTMRYVYHSYLADKEFIKNSYKDKLPHDLPDYGQEPDNKYTYLTEKLDKGVSGRVLVTEYWERPSAVTPKGRKVVIVNNTYLVENLSNPFNKYGRYSLPFVPFYWKKAHDDIYGINTFNDAVNIQIEINMIASLIMDNIRRTSNIFWFVPKGSGIKVKDLDSKAGSVVEYNPASGSPPVQGSPAALPPHTLNHLSTLFGAAQDVDGIHEVSQGQLPMRGSQMSGSALKLLIDSEQVRQAPAMRLLKTSYKILARILLLIVQDKMTEKRILSIVGKSKGYDIKTFKGDIDLKGDIDVQVKIGSAFTSSPASKIDALYNLWDRQVLQAAAQGDKAAIDLLSALEYGNYEGNKLEELNRNKARNVIKEIVEKGTVPPISEFADDHSVQLRVLKEYALTSEYNELPPEVRAAIDSRIDAQTKLLQEQSATKQQQGKPQPQQGQPMPADAGMAMSMGGEG